MDAGKKTPQPPKNGSKVPRQDDLTKDERPGGELEMPTSDRRRPQRDDSNSERDSNDLGSGVST